MNLPKAVQVCCQTLLQAGFAAHPVGGCVRDLLLGRVPADWDVTTAAPPEAVLSLFPRCVPTGLKHGTVTVLLEDAAIEVTTFRRESGYGDGRHPDTVTFDAGLEEDLARRDFTINAMALDVHGGVIDPWGGRQDLAERRIRCVGAPEQRFKEDALRMLRCVRFSAQLGFTIAPETANAIAANAFRAKALSGERVRGEVEKILLSDAPECVAMLLAWGLLARYLQGPCPDDWSTLRQAECSAVARWAAFCALTDFPLEALPVERALLRGVRHPEQAVIRSLALSGGALCALGLKGPEVGAAQRRLAQYVLAHPEKNQRAALLEQLGCGTPAGASRAQPPCSPAPPQQAEPPAP